MLDSFSRAYKESDSKGFVAKHRMFESALELLELKVVIDYNSSYHKNHIAATDFICMSCQRIFRDKGI